MFEKEYSPEAAVQKAQRRIAFHTALCLIGALVLGTCTSARAATMTEIYGFPSGQSPYAGVIQGSNGNLYGTTPAGGPSKKGTVFQITTSGQLVSSIPFNGNNGAAPYAPLIQGADGTLYGTTRDGGSQGKGTVFKVTSDGTLSVLFSFGAKTNGSSPMGGLTLVSNNMLYGTASQGGSNGNGTIFRISTAGANFQPLVSFTGTNGANPYAAMVLGRDGNLYGTTKYGGTSGLGTAFKMTPDGKLTSLVSFDGDNGALPNGLILASDGNFYGTTTAGGPDDMGLVFKLKSSGSLSTDALFSWFNGAAPEGTLLQAANGNFYGTTLAGGSGSGAIFKLNSSALTPLIVFDGTNGWSPACTLIQASDGTFYGTSQAGGSTGEGNLFRISGFSPVIVKKITKQSVTLGSTVVFAAGVVATPPYTFKWQKDGVDLVDGGTISGTTTSQLTLTNVSMADAGSYTVTVSNADGSDSDSATLTVIGDTVRPTVSFVSPAANLRSNSITINGLATDNGQVASVSYWLTNVNNGVITVTGPNQATLVGTNFARRTWTATPQMLPGTNIVAVQAQDTQTNLSAIVSRTFFAIQQTPLTLAVTGTGSGSIAPRPAIAREALPTNGALLNIGQRYTVQVKAGKNSLFAGWAGSLGPQSNPTLSFIMEPGLTLEANFVTNRFLVAAGTYNGLFAATNNPQPASSGSLTRLIVDSTGAYSGRLVLGGTALGISGRFDPFGSALQTLKTAQGPIVLAMHFDWAAEQIVGTLSQTNWTAVLTAERAGNSLPVAAAYNFLIPTMTETNAAAASGYGQLLNRGGAVTLSGALGDGTALSQTIAVSTKGRIPVYTPLYKNSGVLFGWLDMSSGSPVGQMIWIKNAETAGFTNETAISGWRWTPPTRTTYALSQTNFALTIWGADLTTPIRCQMQATAAYSLVKVGSVNPQLGSPNAVSGQINPSTGLVKLTFAAENSKTSVTAWGVADPVSGLGVFTKNGLSGAFRLEPLASPVQ